MDLDVTTMHLRTYNWIFGIQADQDENSIKPKDENKSYSRYQISSTVTQLSLNYERS